MYPNDQLTNPSPSKIYILNLQNADEPGSHWVLLANHYYFDPYGAVPTTAIAPFVKSYNQEDFQGISEESCGYYCMYVADNIIAGRPPTTGLTPGKQRLNAQVLHQHFFG